MIGRPEKRLFPGLSETSDNKTRRSPQKGSGVCFFSKNFSCQQEHCLDAECIEDALEQRVIVDVLQIDAGILAENIGDQT